VSIRASSLTTKEYVYSLSDISARSGGFVGRGELVIGVSVDSLDDRELKSSTSH